MKHTSIYVYGPLRSLHPIASKRVDAWLRDINTIVVSRTEQMLVDMMTKGFAVLE